MAKNILGEELMVCSETPLTGFYRDGCCNTGPLDAGTHTVCAQVTDEFLEYSKDQGNDLKSPRPEYNFPGLKEGDFWCLCVNRWLEAKKFGVAPKIKLSATHEATLNYVSLEELQQYSIA